MNSRLAMPIRALQVAIGLTATLAGFDKFFNILADWGAYVSPAAAAILPVSVPTVMAVIGVIEMGVGVLVLVGAPRLGAYVASAWLLLVAVNLVAAGHFDVAVRDVVIAIAETLIHEVGHYFGLSEEEIEEIEERYWAGEGLDDDPPEDDDA